jgi:hypothetical protein
VSRVVLFSSGHFWQVALVRTACNNDHPALCEVGAADPGKVAMNLGTAVVCHQMRRSLHASHKHFSSLHVSTSSLHVLVAAFGSWSDATSEESCLPFSLPLRQSCTIGCRISYTLGPSGDRSGANRRLTYDCIFWSASTADTDCWRGFVL